MLRGNEAEKAPVVSTKATDKSREKALKTYTDMWTNH